MLLTPLIYVLCVKFWRLAVEISSQNCFPYKKMILKKALPDGYFGLKITYWTWIGLTKWLTGRESNSSNILTRDDILSIFVVQTTTAHVKFWIFLKRMFVLVLDLMILSSLPHPVCHFLHTLYSKERKEIHLFLTLHSWIMVVEVRTYYVIHSELHQMQNQNNHRFYQ